MTAMTLQVPEALEKDHDETVRFLAAKLYEAGKLSLGEAAEMCGLKNGIFLKSSLNLISPTFNTPQKM